MDYMFSLVDRHESYGVEDTGKQFARHVRVLTQEERIKDKWSSPTVLPLIEYLVNSHVSSETGIIPLEATFGSQDAIYLNMPQGLNSSDRIHEFVCKLDENLQHLRAVSKQFQDQLILERTSSTPAETQNKYQAGDFVLFERDKSAPRPNKLSPDFLGPFEVISQNKNDVTTRNLVYGNVREYHVERLKPFFGSRNNYADTDHYDVDRIIVTYRGETRTTMEFLVLFKSGDSVWLPYSQDIFQMVQFEEFCLVCISYSIHIRLQKLGKRSMWTYVLGVRVGIRLLGYPICSILDKWTSGRSLDGRRNLLACSGGVRFMVSFSTMLVCLIGNAGEN